MLVVKEKEYTDHLHATEARWFAIYTNFKREKLVAKNLQQKGIQAYLPLQQVTRQYTRKIRKAELPLINCYVFVKITKEQYVPVLETEHVLKFIRFSKNLIAIPEEEIDLIKRVVGEQLPLEVTPNLFQEGDRVEIVAGNLTGLKGNLVSIEGKKVFVINLEQMGYSLRISLHPSMLRKIDNAFTANGPL